MLDRPLCATVLAGAVATAALVGCTATTTDVAVGDAAAVEAERREQARFAVRTWAERRSRLDRLAWPVLAANADVCPETTMRPGIVLRTRWDFAGPGDVYRDAAAEVLGLEDRFVVVDVVPGGPADGSGLRPGDALVAVEGAPAPVVSRERGRQRAAERLDGMLRDAGGDGALDLRVSRKSPAGLRELVDVAIRPARVCDYEVLLAESDALNAFADGEAIYLTTGMLRFAAVDVELQAVIAHELAHNTEGHVDKTIRNALLGGLLGAIVDIAAASQGIYTDATLSGLEAGAEAFSQDFEREADYVGIYYLERAGIDASEAATFWRRMAAESVDSIVYGRTHPTSPERFVNMNAAVDEVRAKREAGAPLLPSRQDR